MNSFRRAHIVLLAALAASGVAAMLALGPREREVTGSADAEAPEAAGRILYVDDDAPPLPAGDGRNWRRAFRHLQDALDEADRFGSNVREIRVAQGAYKPDQGLWVEPLNQNESFWLIDGLKLRGGYRGRYAGPGDPNARDIDAFPSTLSGDLLDDHFSYDDNSFHIVTASYVGSETLLEGFEIREGTFDPKANPPEPTSGALICFAGAPRIEQCTFADNRGSNTSGSAVLLDSSAEFRKCLFWFNLSDSNSGAMVIVGGHPIIEDCEFTNNVAYYESAGALKAALSAVEIRRCVFVNNSAGNEGGALYLSQSVDAHVIDCDFIRNAADFGGAIRFGGCLFERCRFIDNFGATSGGAIAGGGQFVDCLFEQNGAGWDGGGAVFGGGGFTNCVLRGNSAGANEGGGGALWLISSLSNPAQLTNCLLTGNHSSGTGGAIFVQPGPFIDELLIENCTIANNVGAGSQPQAVVGPTRVHNSIIWGNVGGSLNAALSVSHSCIDGGWPGTNVIESDPMFRNAMGPDGVAGTADDDLRLRRPSPCLDAGSNLLLPPDVFDLDRDGDLQEPLPIDLAGNPRVVPLRGIRIVDVGAYEATRPNAPLIQTSLRR